MTEALAAEVTRASDCFLPTDTAAVPHMLAPTHPTMQQDIVVPTNAYTNKDTRFLKKCLCALRDNMGKQNGKRG